MESIMKRKSIFLGVISSVLALGIVLVIIGFLLGGTIRSFAIERRDDTTQKSVSHELTNEDTIQNLDLQLGANNVTIVSGDRFRITGGKLSKNEVKDGTWAVRSSFADHFSKITVFGIKIPIPRTLWKNNRDMEDITIELPSDAKLNRIALDLNAADVAIETICCSNFKLSLGAGDVSIQKLIADTVVLDVSAGSADVDAFQIADSAKLDCKAGNVAFGREAQLTENFCNNLQADCSMGDFDIAGKLTGKSKVNCAMGDMTLKLYGGEKNYKLVRSRSGMGNIHSESKGSSSDSTVFGSLDLNCSMGDMDILYCGGEN